MAIFGRKNRTDSLKADSKDELKKFDSELRHKQITSSIQTKTISLLQKKISLEHLLS